MIERYVKGISHWRRKRVLAAITAIVLMVFPGPGAARVLAAEIQSYTVSVEELQQKAELEELPEYGAVKTADGKTSTVMWLAVLLLCTGWILDRRYLSEWEEKHDGRKETTKK